MIICPNCSSDSYNYEDFQCQSCDWSLIVNDGISNYFTEHDRESSLAQKYVGNYEELAVKNLENSNIERRFLKNQVTNMVKYISPMHGMDVCDLGIGQGFMCDALIQEKVKSIAAIDVSSSYLKRFVEHDLVTPYLANAENLPFKHEFDLLVSTDVMEHVINVGSFLYCVNRALKEDGIAAIRVPYREGLLGYSPHMGYSHLFGHLRSFNKDLLDLYMTQAGFKIRSFHLDGYSAGTPQPYLYSTLRRKKIYNRIAQYINDRLKHPADATLLNTYLARFFMKPVEVVVIAKKLKDLD